MERTQRRPRRSVIHHHPQQNQQHQSQHQEMNRRRKAAVVYYLCRNNHLDHPHVIEVPISTTNGLYLRDVMRRMNELRGNKMASMYSWACKRMYRSGFVWQDLSEDDPIFPANRNEYILKGSELLSDSPQDGHQQSIITNFKLLTSKQQQESTMTIKTQEFPSPPPAIPDSRNVEFSPIKHASSSSSDNSSPHSKSIVSQGNYNPPCVYEHETKKTMVLTNSSTQTEEIGEGENTYQKTSEQYPQALVLKEVSEISKEEQLSSTPSLDKKTRTLEYLIRADAQAMSRINLPKTKPKAADVIMQLITCGSGTIKDHHKVGLMPEANPRFSDSKLDSNVTDRSLKSDEFDCVQGNATSDNKPVVDKKCYSGTLAETKRHDKKEDVNTSLKRSSSYNANRNRRSPDKKDELNRHRSKCIARTTKIMPSRQSTPRSCVSVSPRISADGSKVGLRRFSDGYLSKRVPKKIDSFGEKEKVFEMVES